MIWDSLTIGIHTKLLVKHGDNNCSVSANFTVRYKPIPLFLYKLVGVHTLFVTVLKLPDEVSALVIF